MDEWNKIRVSLGLAPLQDGGPDDKKAAEEREADRVRREEEEKERRALEVEERVESARRRRKLNEKLEGPTLGDAMEGELGEGETEAMAWVRRSRKLETERKNAARLSTMLDEVDQQTLEATAAIRKPPRKRREPSDDEADRPGAEHLSGVRVAHGVDAIEAGSEVILTLKDGNVMEDEDQLENIDIATETKRRKAIEKSKKLSAYELLELKEKSGGDLLPQYSEERPESFTLGVKGNLDLAKEKQLEDIRRKLQGKLQQRREESLDVSKSVVTSDYLTEEEMRAMKAARKAAKVSISTSAVDADAVAEVEGFRKPSKKRKVRSQTTSLTEILMAEADTENDHGSRKPTDRSTEPEEMDTSSAIQKALRERKSRGVEDSDAMDAYHDSLLMVNDEALEMEIILKRSRNVAARQHISEGETIQRYSATTTANQAMMAQEDKDQIVLSETHEFVRIVQPKAREETQQRELAREADAAREAKEREVRLAREREAMKAERMDVDVKAAEEGEVAVEEKLVEDKHVVLEEDAAPTTLAGALEYAKRKNFLVEQKEAGRTKDPRNILHVEDENDDADADFELSYKDEFGREMTKKEAFRSLSHTFHGRKPGKKKQELRLRKYYAELEDQKRQANPVQASQLLRTLTSQQQKSGQAYVVIQGAQIGTALPDAVAKKGAPPSK